MSHRHRILGGAAGIAIVRLIQLASPIVQLYVFIHGWGIDIYGGWITGVALAAFCTTASLAIIPAIAAETAMNFGREDWRAVADAYRTGAVAVGLSSLALFVLMTAAYLGLAALGVYAVNGLPVLDTVILIAGAAVTGLVNFYCGVLGGVGRYGLSNMIEAIRRGAELLVISALVLGPGLSTEGAAWILLGSALAATIVGRTFLYRYAPSGLSRGCFSIPLLRSLRSSIAGSFCLAFAYNQLFVLGPRLLIGVCISNAAVVEYTVISNLVRIIRQIADIATYPFQNEMSFAFGRQDLAQVRAFFLMASRLAFWVAIFAGLSILILGPFAARILTGGQIEPSYDVLATLTASLLIECASLAAIIFLIAIGRTLRSSVILLITGAAALLVAVLLSPKIGLEGFAITNLVATTIYATVLWRIALHTMDQGMGQMFAAMTRPPVKEAWRELRKLSNRLP